MGMPVTNTALLRAIAKATNIVTLENLEKTVETRFNSALAEKNFAVIKESSKAGKGLRLKFNLRLY